MADTTKDVEVSTEESVDTTTDQQVDTTIKETTTKETTIEPELTDEQKLEQEEDALADLIINGGIQHKDAVEDNPAVDVVSETTTEENSSANTNEKDTTIIEDSKETNDAKEGMEEVNASSDNVWEDLSDIGINGTDDVKKLHDAFVTQKAKASLIDGNEDRLALLGDIPTDRLALAIEALNGSQKAIKQIFKDKSIDPLDLIIDDENEEEWTPDMSKVESAVEEKNLNRAITVAETYGVKSEFVNNISGWDQGSVKDIVSNSGNTAKLVKDIQSGRFDEVNNKISLLKRQDYDDKLSKLDSFDLYSYASNMIDKENDASKDENKNSSSEVQIKTSTEKPAEVVEQSNSTATQQEPVDIEAIKAQARREAEEAIRLEYAKSASGAGGGIGFQHSQQAVDLSEDEEDRLAESIINRFS